MPFSCCLFLPAHHLGASFKQAINISEETYRDGNIKLLVASVELPAKSQDCVRRILVAGEQHVILSCIWHWLAR